MPEAGSSARPFLIGISLKMYLDPAATQEWSASVARIARDSPAVTAGAVTLLVLPSLPSLSSTVEIFADTPVRVGAQDLFWEDRGPYTGAVSGTDLFQVGCRYVEVGHTERRLQFGDDDKIVRMKVAAALRNGLTPVLCIGEPTKTSAAEAGAWCIDQLESALGNMPLSSGPESVVVAYEPVWAIGAERAADPAHVIAVAGFIRSWLDARSETLDSTLIYGGSAGVGTLTQLAGAVDGLFLGRFAHDPNAVRQILEEATAAR